MASFGFGGNESAPDPARAASTSGFAFDEGSQDWQRAQDTRLGFVVDHPAGWTVSADEHTILTKSADGGDFVLAVSFSSAPGEAAASSLGRFASAYPSLFPQAQVTRVTPQPAQSGTGSEAIGALSFQGAQGPGEARILCSVSANGNGMLYALAAPAHRFETERPTLVRILKSLTFGTTQENSTQGAGKPEASPLTYVAWTDPREGAFHIEVPQGWTVDGGLFRFGPTDTRAAVQAFSPENDMIVQIGDPSITSFNVPSPFLMQMGLREGQVYSPTGTFQSMVLRYLPARDFNRWYLQTHLSTAVDAISLVSEQDLPDAARQQAMQFQQINPSVSVEVTMAQVEFTGRSRQSGKPVTGLLLSTITRFPPDPMGGGMWVASPMFCGCTVDEQVEARKEVTVNALLHMIHTRQDDPQWSQRNAQQQAQILQDQARQNQQNQHILQQNHETAMENIRQAGERSRAIARESDARRASIMGSYWSRQAANDDIQRQRLNYLSDQTDVRNPNTGEAWKVGSGYSHYYRNDRTDTVIGTNSAYSPGVDFTPLDEY